ncbi:hypothetical protein KGQ19_45835 [Catenulispora sp. NL8]|uniref:Uncharacterized protein n=1 Tax=Catenulispora pinistramenti TaxID=2705254 RepID=A0ABS5L7K7_9ACTN|nr:hypothetical protein [Catenulispora pinistramenti]MBS2554200.1 hypothetical protein [Catenulispora pinistramenti]
MTSTTTRCAPRWACPATRGSWGGPTYAGVWAVHGAGGIAMLVVAFLLARLYVRPLVRHLARRRSR